MARELKRMAAIQWNNTEVRIFFDLWSDFCKDDSTAGFERTIKEIIGDSPPDGMEINSEIFRNEENFGLYDNALGFEVIFNKQQCNQHLYEKYFHYDDVSWITDDDGIPVTGSRH
eukprot:360236_1